MNYKKNQKWKIKLSNNLNNNYKTIKWRLINWRVKIISLKKINNHLIKNLKKVKIMKKMNKYKN